MITYITPKQLEKITHR